MSFSFKSVFRASLAAKTVALAAMVLLVVLAVFASGKWKDRGKVLRVGFSQFAPYVIVNEAGQPEGLAVEMVKRAARVSGVPIRWVLLTGEIDAALTKGDIDLYPLLTLTDNRKKDFYYSQAWWENEIALISVQEHPLRFAADTSGKRVAIRGLPILKTLAEKLFPKAQLVTVPRMEDMVGALCNGGVDGIFLDLRLLESQLLKGTSQCPGHALYVASIPNGSLSLATIARPSESRFVDPLYEAIVQFSADGTLSEIASKWSLYNPYQTRHVKEALDAQHRASLMRFGLMALITILILISYQTQRIGRSRAVANSARLLAEESQHRFDAFMRYMPAVAFIKNAEGHLEFINDAFCRLFGLAPDHVLGKADHDLWPAKMAARFRENDVKVLSSNGPAEMLEEVLDEAGQLRTFLSHKFSFVNSMGNLLLGGVAIDVTERLEAENALRLSQFSIDCADDTMLWIDETGKIFNANRAACRTLGYEEKELVSLHISRVDPLVELNGFALSRTKLKAMGSLTVESIHRRKDGVTFPVEIRQNFLEFQGHEYSCCMSRDITERKRAEAELSRQALHDALTGLPNRRYLEKRLASIIEQARSRHQNVGVVYLDLDGFKLVNDTLGHAVGDQLLKKVALRLQESLRGSDMLFRMGGDEFTLVLNDVSDQPTVALIAHKVLANLHECFTIEPHDLSITASLGISMFPCDGDDESQLLCSADAAMYESKRQGKNRIQFFTREMGEQARERLDLENNLRRAVSRNELSLDYQPEFCIHTGKILRHEALLRWNHPTLGSIPPLKFIPIAEETALIVPIGTWVLEQACRRAHSWQADAEGVGVGVNVSLLQFARTDFVETVTDILTKTGLNATLLELELTESVLMRNVEDTAEKVSRLRSLGVSVSIDDFGTGYSSLSYLQKLPINNLKIDRSFIRDIVSDANAIALTGALISMAHSLGMKVVVEGIETAGQLEAIQKLGCDVGQGFLLGMPSAVPALMQQSVAA
jgi:diguanylate cyclase (GGDEF)-like protein/PAS domain S-box-containing protein